MQTHEGLDPSELEPPLYDAFDTDALTALFRSPDDSDTTLGFSYRGPNVCVDGSDRTEVMTTPGTLRGSTAVE